MTGGVGTLARMPPAVKGLLLVAGATFFWSLSGVFVRWAPGVSPWTFNAWRGLGLALSLLIWMALHYRTRLPALLKQTEPRAVLISGGCFALGSTLYILSLQMASVAAVSCICATSGLFAALLARAWLGERAGSMFYGAMVLAIAGVAIIALSEGDVSVSGLTGALVALLVALTFAGQSVSLRRYRAIGMEPAIFAGGLAVFLVIWLGFGLKPITQGQIGMLLFMGLVQLAIPLVMFMRGARHVPAAQMVLVSMADAALNPLWVWLVFDEVPSRGVFAGGALVLLAIAVNAWPHLRMAMAR